MTDRNRAAFARLARLADAHGLDLRGARVRRSSSRFCLGVEHGDYNGTALFGVGTDRFLWLAYAPNDRGRIRLVSANFEAEGLVEVDPAAIPPPGTAAGWARYPLGAAAILAREGLPLRRGLDVALYGDIPGGGMSRSASLCVNLLLTLLEVNELELADPFRLVELSQAIENDYVGSPCGLLDQTMIRFAKAGHGTLFDPASRQVSHVPLGPAALDFRLLALDTGTVRPGLETSTYRVRRAECEELVRLANQAGFAIPNLAAVRSPDQLAALEARFGASHPQLVERLRYIHAAQARFDAMLEAWRQGDLATVGALFRADGLGLRDQYRISGPELETICDLARSVEGCLGERMLGGGDKGAAGAIVRADAVAEVRRAVEVGYPRSHPELAGRQQVHELGIVDGVTVFDAPF
jgi:galactokinase